MNKMVPLINIKIPKHIKDFSINHRLQEKQIVLTINYTGNQSMADVLGTIHDTIVAVVKRIRSK